MSNGELITYLPGDKGDSGNAKQFFYVKDFGAKADGVSDAGPAIRAAIAAAISSGKDAEVRFERGRYRVEGGQNNEAAVRIVGASKLVLKGEGSDTVIVAGNPLASGIEVVDCDDVLIQALAVDYDPLPYTQGTVAEARPAEGWFTFRIDDSYRQLDESYFKEVEARWGLVVRGAGGPEPRYGPHPLLDLTWEKSGDSEWRVKVSNPEMLQASGMQPGDRYVHMARRHYESAIIFWRTNQAALRDVTVYAGPALATIWGQNKNVEIDGLRVEVLPGSNRLLSANGDGIHNLNTRGNLIIQNCSFSGMADDAINIHVRAGTICRVLSPDILHVRGGLFEALAGDTLQIYSPQLGQIRAEAQVLHAAKLPDETLEIKLDREISNALAGNGLHDSDHVYNLSACGRGFVVRGNHFGRHRGRGILVRSLDGTIEGNTFTNAEGWGVAVQHEPDWEEGPLTRNLSIVNNTFKGDEVNVMASIHIAAGIPAGVQAADWGQPITGISIKDNQFLNPQYPLIHIQSAANIVICDNHVKELLPGTGSDIKAIETENAQGVEAEEAWSG
ncbi:right-handed parallel beta-helix repeat-containing protein [Paenibacillus sp. PAMC21692]|uniref:right-handed parallel beta-helix repeat-containing protein n=1 Tax=Paenibacillus sp. PAMC21692 TaxID=2762320 RepID=UPI00164DC639|nr:right-handed parallel beta-helix repeat-containing protein [Paenibacillus sp. PAMC21692]QNK59395.1 right-handed parallel beta-helix repeat-containing protein [Paenibacillus sp. PAMC21692]